jgi:uncharacterized protein
MMNRHESFIVQAGSDLSRRGFIKTAAAAAASIAVESSLIHGAEITTKALIDTNVSLDQWPFRHTKPGNTSGLVAVLRKQGVAQAWVSSFDALLHQDIASVNIRLADECKQHGAEFLVPLGAINPKLPDWEEDLRRCDEAHRMPGIRLHPNYHGYKLDDPAFKRLLQLANERNMLVQISVIMEDERTIHPLANVPPTDTTPLQTTLKEFPKIRLQLLNAFQTLKGTDGESLAALGIHFEIATLEGVNGIEKLLRQIPISNLCFGSYAPVFYFASAKLKLQESELGGMQMMAICANNAIRLLNKS